ncbi:MAG: hypothetical protein AABM64_13055 [Pseudomonadota bacterium]
MNSKKRPYGYWTNKKNVLADAKKYSYQAEWARASGGAFHSAKKSEWLAKACQHMSSPHKPMGHWTLANLLTDAQQYQSKSEWRKNSPSAYAIAGTKGCLARCCEHMAPLQRPKGYWTKEKCIESARRYDTIIAWSLAEGAAYDAAKRRHWYRDATKHMVRTYSHGEYTTYCFLLQHDIFFEHQKRFVDLKDKKHLPYDFYLPDYDLVIEYQGRQHFEASPTSMFRKNLGAQLRRDALKKGYAGRAGLSYLQIEAQKTDEIETALVAKLKEIAAARGNTLVLVKRELNQEEKKVLASLGTWTKEAVLADAQRYRSLKDWANCGNSACQIAYKNGWIDEATKHMTPSQKPKGYWTKERVLNDAKQYKSRMEWFKASQSAYATAQAKGWLSEATAHMTRGEAKG